MPKPNENPNQGKRALWNKGPGKFNKNQPQAGYKSRRAKAAARSVRPTLRGSLANFRGKNRPTGNPSRTPGDPNRQPGNAPRQPGNAPRQPGNATHPPGNSSSPFSQLSANHKRRMLYNLLKDLHPKVRVEFRSYPPVVQLLAKLAITGQTKETHELYQLLAPEIAEQLQIREGADWFTRFGPLIAMLKEKANQYPSVLPKKGSNQDLEVYHSDSGQNLDDLDDNYDQCDSQNGPPRQTMDNKDDFMPYNSQSGPPGMSNDLQMENYQQRNNCGPLNNYGSNQQGNGPHGFMNNFSGPPPVANMASPYMGVPPQQPNFPGNMGMPPMPMSGVGSSFMNLYQPNPPFMPNHPVTLPSMDVPPPFNPNPPMVHNMSMSVSNITSDFMLYARKEESAVSVFNNVQPPQADTGKPIESYDPTSPTSSEDYNNRGRGSSEGDISEQEMVPSSPLHADDDRGSRSSPVWDESDQQSGEDFVEKRSKRSSPVRRSTSPVPRSEKRKSKDWRYSRDNSPVGRTGSSRSKTSDMRTKERSPQTADEDELYKEFFNFMSTKGRPEGTMSKNDSRAKIEQPKRDDRSSGHRASMDRTSRNRASMDRTSVDRSRGNQSKNERSTQRKTTESPSRKDRSCNPCYRRIAIVVAASSRKLYRSEVEMIEHALFKRITAKDSPKFHGIYRESGAVVFICDDDQSAQWLVKTAPFILPWAGAMLKAEPWCKRQDSIELFFDVPSIVSSLPWATLCEKIAQQNVGLLTSEWKALVEDDTIRVCCIDKASLRNLRKRQFKAFLGFVQIEFKLIADASA